MDAIALLSRVLEGHAPEAARTRLAEGLSRALGDDASSVDRARLFGLYTAAGRRFARATERWDEPARELLRAAGYAAPDAITLADVARARILLAALAHLPAAEHGAFLMELMQTGDTKERVALLRSLNVLPEPERFADVGVEACRSHVQTVLEAIACDNAFPARAFSELAWNQLVMKMVFVGLPLARVVGVPERNNPELVRMAHDYAAERRAAGRLVPEDLARILDSQSEEHFA
jgi:hypothetical protein